jgi:hypothetical protein
VRFPLKSGHQDRPPRFNRIAIRFAHYSYALSCLTIAFIFSNAQSISRIDAAFLQFCNRLDPSVFSCAKRHVERHTFGQRPLLLKDKLPMNRRFLTVLATALSLFVFSEKSFANDSPLAFFNTQNETDQGKKSPSATAASARNSKVGGAITRGTDGPAAADVAKIADQLGVPRGLALSVCRVETRCRYGLVGRAGERGPLQIKLQTARGLGYTGGATGLNGYNGAYWGMKHLAVAYQKCGTAKGAARLHNAGLASSCGGSNYASRVVAGL